MHRIVLSTEMQCEKGSNLDTNGIMGSDVPSVVRKTWIELRTLKSAADLRPNSSALSDRYMRNSRAHNTGKINQGSL